MKVVIVIFFVLFIAFADASCKESLDCGPGCKCLHFTCLCPDKPRNTFNPNHGSPRAPPPPECTFTKECPSGNQCVNFQCLFGPIAHCQILTDDDSDRCKIGGDCRWRYHACQIGK